MGLQWGSQRKPTRERSLRPEPPGGTVEATKPFQHSGKRPRQGVRERAGHNMSEHRASFEKGNADADPVEIGGRLVFSGKKTWFRVRKDMMSDKRTGEVRRSRGDGMRAEEAQRNTGSPPRWGQAASTGTPRGAGRSGADGGGGRGGEAAPTAARPVWTASPSSKSKSAEWPHGWKNGRKRCGRKLTVRWRFDGCIYQSRT